MDTEISNVSAVSYMSIFRRSIRISESLNYSGFMPLVDVRRVVITCKHNHLTIRGIASVSLLKSINLVIAPVSSRNLPHHHIYFSTLG